MKSKPFITLQNISLRLQNNLIFENTSWEIKNNENWLILGPNGAGKSTLAKALLGQVPVVAGRIAYHFFENKSQFRSNINKAMGYVSPELARRVFEKELFQEEIRHFTGRLDQKTTLADIVVEGQDNFMDSTVRNTRLYEIAKATNIEKLLDRDINALSTGEISRALIARALVKGPKLLILDEPFDGLDKKSRDQLSATIDDLISRDLRIILITQRFEEIVPGMTHVLYVKDGRIHSLGVKEELLTRQNVNEVFGITSPSFSRLNYYSSKAANHEAQNETVHGPLLEMNKVEVKYGEVVPLSDFTWTAQQNENWIIFGPEGAGKTTILKLIVGENLQSYANDIHLFGKKRGGGQSIWEIRRNIGFVSSDLQSKYAGNIPLRDVVLSGFHDTIGLYRQSTKEEIEIADNWLSLVGISDCSQKPFGQLSHGQRQLALVARAMVKTPLLLLLDEPFNGLDISRRIRLSRPWITSCSILRPISFMQHTMKERSCLA
jgi:molybdate transport system ATP-binding protein